MRAAYARQRVCRAPPRGECCRQRRPGGHRAFPATDRHPAVAAAHEARFGADFPVVGVAGKVQAEGIGSRMQIPGAVRLVFTIQDGQAPQGAIVAPAEQRACARAAGVLPLVGRRQPEAGTRQLRRHLPVGGVAIDNHADGAVAARSHPDRLTGDPHLRLYARLAPERGNLGRRQVLLGGHGKHPGLRSLSFEQERRDCRAPNRREEAIFVFSARQLGKVNG